MGEILRISLTFSNLMPRDRQRFGREIFNRSERPLFGKMTSKFPSCIKFEGSERDQIILRKLLKLVKRMWIPKEMMKRRKKKTIGLKLEPEVLEGNKRKITKELQKGRELEWCVFFTKMGEFRKIGMGRQWL